MRAFKLKYKPFGERSILVEWPSEIDKYILNDVLSFKNTLQKSLIEDIVEVKSAYNSILITYQFTIDNVYNKTSTLKRLYSARVSKNKCVFMHWRIPVCYDVAFGIDLEAMAVKKKVPIDDIIKHHSQAIYTVYFIGFLPGFLYLGGLNEKLHIPRKVTPRLKVEKGAVAIGGNQTGVYPNVSPGGWHIIGNSPISFFNNKKENPCFAKAGDKIEFYAISKEKYDNIKALVDAGVYQLESEVIYG